MKHGLSQTQAYWTTCIQTILRGPRTIQTNLDLPLDAGIERARWFTAWTVLHLSIGLLVAYPKLLQGLIKHLGKAQDNPFSVETILLWLLLSVLATPVVYGLLRLYTLVNHVMVINVFKSRGQRLRLLNVEATLLSVTPVFTIGLVIRNFLPLVGVLLITVTALHVLFLLGYGFDLIFHKRGIQGLFLVLGSYIVTGFVLLMGGLAITVSLAVIAFLVLAFLRLFSLTK